MLSRVGALRRCVSLAGPSSASTTIVFADRPLRNRMVALQARSISAAEVFKVKTDQLPSDFSLPPVPTPLPPSATIEELVAQGESVLSELGLFSWWKPSSYLRLGLEYLHIYTDLPWWATIVAGTVILRLLLIGVPIMSQRNIAKQSKYRPELKAFQARISDAQREGNSMLVQQILMEQQQFLKSKDIRLGRQMVILLANGSVFLTQFFAIRRLADVNYPGLETGGFAWFTDLTAVDPYYMLPAISALTMAAVLRVGIESGASSEQFTPIMRIGFQYALPVVVFAASSSFPTALCVYWCTSNAMSLFYAGFFRVPAVRKLLDIPAMPPPLQLPGEQKKNVFREAIDKYKNKNAAPPSISELRKRDAQQFKKAGKSKPIV